MRLFISIDLPQSLSRKIYQRIPQFKGIRVTQQDQLHLTLVFMGEQPEFAIDSIDNALQHLHFPALQLTLSDIGQFRSGVIWLGVKHNPELLNLQRKIQQQLQPLFELQHRKFHPHLTLARSKHRLHPDQLRLFTEAFSEQEFSFSPRSISLKQSRLYPEGARHTLVGEWHVSETKMPAPNNPGGHIR